MLKTTDTYFYIRFKAFHSSYLNNFFFLLRQELRSWGILQYSLVFLPKRVERFTVLRSPHVDKKARDQFERITHQRLLVIKLPKQNKIFAYRLLQFISFAALGIEVSVRYVTKVSSLE